MAINAPELTKAQRKALAKKVAAAREAKKTGDQIRADLRDRSG